MRKIVLHSLFIFGFLIGQGQQTFDQLLVDNEKELAEKFSKLRAARTNKDLKELNETFIQGLKVMLNQDGAFTYPFESLTSMSKITSPDKAFRLFNWNVEMQDGSQQFYCFILTKKGEIIELTDKHKYMDNAESRKLTEANWYGAVYYEIIPLKGGDYTLLGWNGKNALTTQKIIEVMSLSKNKAKFGESIFKFEDSRDKRRRFILEYADDAFVSLKYKESKKEGKQIVFSHLSPSTPQTEGHYQFYYPDLSYDSFVLENNKWVYQSSVDIRNKPSEKDKLYINPLEDNSTLDR